MWKALFAALFAVTTLHAQTTIPAETKARALRDEALRDPTAWTIVRDLTTRFGPRPAGSPAERAAAEWTAQQMKNLGLSNVRIQSFPLAPWQRGAERGEIVGPPAQPLAITALGGIGATPEQGVEGEVAIFATLADLQAAPPNSLTGKVAMVNYQMPRLESGQGYGIASAARGQGPVEAAQRGAVAFVLRSAGTAQQHRLPHTGSTRLVDGKAPIPAFALSGPDADQIERLAQIGPVRLRLFSSAQLVPGGTSQNVIGEIPGQKRDEIIVIGAHLDSWDLGTGAVDDGAGVAIVMAAAKMLAAQKPQRTIRVVLYGSEEVSQPQAPFFLAGANAYAEGHKDDTPRTVIASESDLGAGRIYSLGLPEGWAAAEIGSVAGRVLLPLGIILSREPAPHGGADSFPLQQAGRPVFLLFQDASQYFDLHHTADDTLDKIDPAALNQNVAAWTSLVWLLSELAPLK